MKFTEQEYKDKVNAIFVRFPSIQKVGFGDAYKPGLEHIETFEAMLGNPHENYRTIHVAGTNGKGSVANMLASALSAVGLRVGLYTSPHLEDFRERMRICDKGKTELVSREYVFDFLAEYSEDFERLDLSFFEITTGMAFRWFSDENVDVAVIEVGLGGRLDSTNVITPDLSVVTSIGMDHCDLLGHTLAAIAGEKAGIFKKDVPALVGEYVPETKPIFEAKAKDLCPLSFAQDKVPSMWNIHEDILEKMDLRGHYQEKNLRTALSAIDILAETVPFKGYSGLKDVPLVASAIEKTAERMDFHGRWERLGTNPLILADIGHNPPALKENFSQLENMLESGECSSLIIVYAVMADKDLDGIMPLMPENAVWIFTAPSIRRSLPAHDLCCRYRKFCEDNGRDTGRIYESGTVRESLEMAVKMAGDAGSRPLIYVGGSSYLVSEAVPLVRGK